ncbi:MAG: ribulose-phosphate 3-epimerase [Tannerellaceae bacterium]|jgi:ribulose-phosphate 3-epimerase|nr:ribulose-phosphate 3-epimerase [Tannerellaceae bacterium]
MKSHLLSPSLLSADFLHLEESVELVNVSEADWLHLDVMDGVFVPNISFGFPVMEAVSRVSRKPLDVHLMIVEPEKFIGEVKSLGAYMMNVHWEACRHLHRTVKAIQEAGMQAGVTLNPQTPVSMLEEMIGEVDMVLLMSVNPGYGGQKFIEGTLQKVERLKELILSKGGGRALIEVDGGVTVETGRRLVEAGADVLVSGSYIFGSVDPLRTIRELKAM